MQKKKNQRIFNTVIAFILVCGLCGIFPQHVKKAEAKSYYKVDRYGILYKYRGKSRVTIKKSVTAINPTTFNDVNVTSFQVVKDNKSYTAKDGILYNKSMTRLIRVPNSYKGVFQLSSTVKSIEKYAFYNCSSITKITLNNHITKIPSHAFERCSKLEEISFTRPVQVIGSSAFSRCKMLKSISLQKGLKKIGPSAFAYCYSLNSINVPQGVKEIGGYCFYQCIGLQRVKIQNGINRVGESAFFGDINLRSVTIDGKIKLIESSLFQGCEKLSSFTIPDSVETIQSNAFCDCKNLQKITIPKNVEEIGSAAFLDCDSLSTVKLPNNVTEIGYSTFKNCISLKNIKLPAELELMGDESFMNCPLMTKINIPEKVSRIGDRAFAFSGTYFTVSKDNETYYSKGGVIYHKDKLMFYPGKKSGSFTVPTFVTSIDDSAFYGATKLETLVLSKNIEKFSLYSIVNCTRLKKIVFPASIKEIYAAYYEDYQLLNLKEIQIDSKNENYKVYNGALYTKDYKTLILIPFGKTGSFKVHKNTKSLLNLDYTSNKFDKITIQTGNKYFCSQKGVLYNKKMTSICLFPGKMTSYVMPSTLRYYGILKNVKENLALKSISVSNNKYYSSKKGILYSKNGKKILYVPSGKSGTIKIDNKITNVEKNALTYVSGITLLTGFKNCKNISLDLTGCKKLKKIVLKEGAAVKLSLEGDTGVNIRRITLPTTVANMRLLNMKRGAVIDGYLNTGIEAYAKVHGYKFHCLGYVPSKVRNISLKAIVNQFELHWKKCSHVDGYQIYINSSRFKQLALIRNANINSCIVTSSQIRDYSYIYIRAYVKKGKKRLYGKPGKIWIKGMHI